MDRNNELRSEMYKVVKENREVFIMVFTGNGPWDESYTAPASLTWPLPQRIKAKMHPEGHYSKVFESKGEPKPGEARGARYEWKEEPY